MNWLRRIFHRDDLYKGLAEEMRQLFALLDELPLLLLETADCFAGISSVMARQLALLLVFLHLSPNRQLSRGCHMTVRTGLLLCFDALPDLRPTEDRQANIAMQLQDVTFDFHYATICIP